MKMTSEQWVMWGRVLFATGPHAVRQWLDGKAELPETDGFLFWCNKCSTEFKSQITPRNCPSCGCSADTLDNAVELSHKGYTANTFPFSTPAIKE